MPYKKSIKTLATDFINNKSEYNFTQLITQIKPCIYPYIIKYVNDREICEDILGDTFVKVWKNIDTYNPEYSFITWVFSIAKHEAMTYLRDQQSENREIPYNEYAAITHQKMYYEMDVECIGPNNQQIVDVLYNVCIDSIKNMEETKRKDTEYKQILFRRWVSEMKLIDIAEDLDIPIDTVKTRVGRSTELLGKTIRNKYPSLVKTYYERDEVI